MADIWTLFSSMISTWWDFLWTTEVPRTGFSFGALYGFLILLSLFVFLVRVASNHPDKEGKS